MKNKKYAVCNECGSKFLKSSSVMESLCPECASIIYGIRFFIGAIYKQR